MDLYPVPDYPALVIPGEEDILVVADIHLGMEYELLRRGINLPSQVQILKAEVEYLLSATGAARLVILGDVKHNIPSISALEAKAVPSFLSLGVPVTLVKGNHDGGIEPLAGMPAHPYLVLNDTLLVHGHMRLPDVPCRRVVMAHAHPAVEITDELGKRTREKCWIRGHLPDGRDLVVMPAFNSLITGIPLNRAVDDMPGPVLSLPGLDRGALVAYLLDGTCLGPLSAIR